MVCGAIRSGNTFYCLENVVEYLLLKVENKYCVKVELKAQGGRIRQGN
jgi:hypothetical protein